MVNIVGKIPEFTKDEVLTVEPKTDDVIEKPSEETGIEEVKETATEEVVEKEKETPAEPPAEEKPAETEKVEVKEEVDTLPETLERAKTGLEEEILRLRKEISELRGQRRELKREELIKTEQKLDNLNDLNPDDVSIIDRVLRAKGLITKEEANKMFYDAVQQDELSKFLEKYPEYRPENDPQDINWVALQKELGYYRMPDDPHQIREVLERAHKAVVKVSTVIQALPAKRKQVQIAGVGAGGVQKSSVSKQLDPRKRAMLEQGGWTEEEIRKIEQQS